jgi:predicted RNA-binding Zn-ribbon protein involved in translation (DUF1610 family)
MEDPPIFQCPACKHPTDTFPCPKCGRSLTPEEKGIQDKLIGTVGGVDTLKFLRDQAEDTEREESLRYACPQCGSKGDIYPCPKCGHELNAKEKEVLEYRIMVVNAMQESHRAQRDQWRVVQAEKAMGIRDSQGKLKQTGCAVLLLSLIAVGCVLLSVIS